MKTFAAMGAAASMIVTPMAVSAAPMCLSGKAQEAVKLRQLDVMLMVGSLRCRAGADDYRADYDAFLINHRKELGAANRVILADLSRRVGSRGAMNALDKISVSIANTYGNGAGRSCHELRAISKDLAHDRSPGALKHAANTLVDEDVPGGGCSVTFARRR